MCLNMKDALSVILIFSFSFYFASAKSEHGKCGGVLTWNEQITLPVDKNGHYGNNLHCIFESSFKRDIDPNVLVLKWFSFDISGNMAEGCSNDYLEIFVSCSYKSLGRFCGSRPPSEVISPDRCMRLEFHSDSKADSSRGFEARLVVTARLKSLTPLYNYRYFVNSSSGILSSPEYPGYYPVRCPSQKFVFEAQQKRSTMRLYFMEFKTKGTHGVCQTSTDDFLRIEVSKQSGNGISPKVQLLCGVRKPFVFTFPDFSRIVIQFVTNNDSSVARGYVAGYMIYKTGISSRSNAEKNALGARGTFFIYLYLVLIGFSPLRIAVLG